MSISLSPQEELQATVYFEQRREEERLRLIGEARIAEEMKDELAALEEQEGIRQAQIEQEIYGERTSPSYTLLYSTLIPFIPR